MRNCTELTEIKVPVVDGFIHVADNAPFHRKEKLRKIALSHNVMILFLPPYSPDYNPIEKLWANMKRWLRKNMRCYDSFEDALEAAIDKYSKVG